MSFEGEQIRSQCVNSSHWLLHPIKEPICLNDETTEEMNASICIDLDSPKDNEHFEMANISKDKTGLCCIIWVETNMQNSNDPKMKFTDNNRMIPVTISKEPQLLANYSLKDLNISSKDLNALFFWIKNNYDALMQFWNGEITTDELIDRIKKN